MRDPHVRELRYKLVPDEGITFDRPPPIEDESEAFRMRLEDNTVTFEMIEHYASKESAKRRVEEYLEAWGIGTGLRAGRREIGFEFESADVIDRDPPPPGTAQVLYAEVAMASAGALSATAHVTRRKYPEPPTGFVVSDDVDTMWRRYERYLDHRESLGSMANFCLTLLEGRAGGRRKRARAAERYGISCNVLNTVGTLSTERGTPATQRKFTPHSWGRDYTGAERNWVEAAVRALIRRAGEYAADPEAPRDRITMADLPQLR